MSNASERIFRAAAIERLSSPEQLDQLVRITRPFDWAAALAIGLVLIAIVVWSLVGDFVLRQNSSQYVQSFTAADVEGPGDPQTRDDWRLVKHARRARMMLYACFLRAGLQAPARHREAASDARQVMTAVARRI